MINSPTGRSIDIYCSPVGDIDIIELMKKYIKILGKVRPTVDGDWSKDKSYDILTIVYDKDSKKSYISRKKVPVGINILNKDYWMNISTTRVDNDSIVLLSNPNDIGQINSFTLQEAVDSFDNEDKRIGLFISFYEKPVHELDTYKWNLYQFIGSDINQFNDITKWISIYNRSNKFLGLYLTEGKLNEVKRSPEVGDYAFVGNTLKEAIIYRCNVNGKWTKTKESAVDYIELKLSGNVTVGENGNWFNDGVDTGFKAKGEDGKTPQIVVSKDNKLQVSYDGVNFTNITENIVYTQYRVSGNKLQYSIDLGKTWNDASGFISANFRWKPTNIAAGKIQISRENEVWEDLSPEFVSNSADEEDLESVIIGDNNRVIREKSIKEYNPAEFSGLGRVILRKNIVQGKNVLTQEMINKPNTVYEIRYDFDLNDATINIPENCILDFKGGKLNNGTVNFNNSYIINTDNKLNIISLVCTGKVKNNVIYPDWFINKEDTTDAIQTCINIAPITGAIILFISNKYLIRGGILNFTSNLVFKSENKSIIYTKDDKNYLSIFTTNHQNIITNVIFDGLIFDQSLQENTNIDNKIDMFCILSHNINNLLIKNCKFISVGTNTIACGGFNENVIEISNNEFYFIRNKTAGNYDNSIIYITNAFHIIKNNIIINDGTKENRSRGGIETHGHCGILSGNTISNCNNAINIVEIEEEVLSNITPNRLITNNICYNCNCFCAFWNVTRFNEIQNVTISNNIATNIKNAIVNVLAEDNKATMRNITICNNYFNGNYKEFSNANNITFLEETVFMLFSYGNLYNYQIYNNVISNFPVMLLSTNPYNADTDIINNVTKDIKFINNTCNNCMNSKVISMDNKAPIYYSLFTIGVKSDIIIENNIIEIIDKDRNCPINILRTSFYIINKVIYKNNIIKGKNIRKYFIGKLEDKDKINIEFDNNLKPRIFNYNNIKNEYLHINDIILEKDNIYIITKDGHFTNSTINVSNLELTFICTSVGLITGFNENILNVGDKLYIEFGNSSVTATVSEIDKNKVYIYERTINPDIHGSIKKINYVECNKEIYRNYLRKGTTSQRPTGVQIGFTYKDTDLNKWIIWNGEAWENIDGTTLD